MYRVYGAEAMMDPTKIELLVRKETEERSDRHDERNQERKLTKEQRKEKKMKKLTENTNVIVNVCVFKVREMSTQHRSKIEKNAQQLFMTGTCVITPSMSLIVVEGMFHDNHKNKNNNNNIDQ
jgi:U4/U6 small nuclear ribonucleoprotein PRP3